MRFMGYALILLTTGALAFDTYLLFNGLSVTRFAGIMDIWTHLDKASVAQAETYVMAELSRELWLYVLLPFMKIPAALLFGLPGFLILRNTRPEIALHVPSALEMELVSQGTDAKQIRELKRRGVL